MATPWFAHGTLLQREALPMGSDVWETIALVTSIDGPGFRIEELETTSHDSVSAFREYIAGLADGGEITSEVRFDPTDQTHDGQTGLFADMLNRTKRNWRMQFPTTPTTRLTVPAFVRDFPVSAPFDGVLSATVTLRVSGAPSLVSV